MPVLATCAAGSRTNLMPIGLEKFTRRNDSTRFTGVMLYQDLEKSPPNQMEPCWTEWCALCYTEISVSFDALLREWTNVSSLQQGPLVRPAQISQAQVLPCHLSARSIRCFFPNRPYESGCACHSKSVHAQSMSKSAVVSTRSTCLVNSGCAATTACHFKQPEEIIKRIVKLSALQYLKI